ncbi:uncharacterized protein TNCV_4859821 [Trichonephila clavipes]|nr:uncharacterized protein TNCV_4859821 [Trichonephila clavipes]
MMAGAHALGMEKKKKPCPGSRELERRALFGNNDPLKRIAYFRLGVLLSGIFFFWPTINIVLLIMVFKRYSDISNSRRGAARDNQAPLHHDSQPPPYTPGPYISRQQSRTIDPAPITGWSHQMLLNFDGEEGLPNS